MAKGVYSTCLEAPKWLLVSIASSIIVLLVLIQSKAFTDSTTDKLLEGLLTTSGFDEASCLSRYESATYWKVSKYKPSSYLQEKLRKYEELHKKCGPKTELYRKATQLLQYNSSFGIQECNYLVWIPQDGLGNRMITLVSAFLYSLLTNKVLLVMKKDELHNLFCEPFPESSWLVPSDFPMKDYINFNAEIPQSFGNIYQAQLQKNKPDSTNNSVPYAYLQFVDHSPDNDRMIFCEDTQEQLRNIPWLFIHSTMYFAPNLFLIKQYRKELKLLFPDKETVFHHLGRYLLHPSNSIWGSITRYYRAYLANANEILGLQIRGFPYAPVSFEDTLSRVINCTLRRNLLPDINPNETVVLDTTMTKLKAVLLTSLDINYSEKLRKMYTEHTTFTGELVSVYQPSHEELQQTEQLKHNMKALSEIFLLSFSDVLITTERSTFGYVAQSLAGLRPWILLHPSIQGHACIQGASMEPCGFTSTTTNHDACVEQQHGYDEKIVRRCEDAQWAFKLFH